MEKAVASGFATIKEDIRVLIANSNKSEEKLSIPVELPLNTEDDVERFENWISEEENSSKLVRLFKYV